MILLYLFAVVVLINCGYFLLFSKFSFLQPEPRKTTDIFPVSVIICAKNEAENLKKNIPLWLAQDYPNFELILINDSSSDDTLEVMESFAKEHPQIHTVDVENNEAFWANKKYALTLGIKRAINQRMLFTDADCHPATDQWIAEMARHFSTEKQIILGYGGYEKKPGLLNALIRFETVMTAVQYFSYALAGMPYMGVGRNLGYTSTLYYENKGFTSHMQVRSGDDDLFVNQAANATNTALSIAPESFTYSTPKTQWSKWILQKRRHITTASYYKKKHQYLLSLYYIGNILFWVLAVLTLVFLDWKIPFTLILFRLLMQYIFVGAAAKNLKENRLIPYLPFLEVLMVFMQLIIFISNRISKPTQWK